MAYSRRLFVAVPCFPASFTDPVARGLPVVTAIDDALLGPSMSLTFFGSAPGPVCALILVAPGSLSPSCKRSHHLIVISFCFLLTDKPVICSIDTIEITSVLRAKLRGPLCRFCATFVIADFPASTSYAKTSRSDLFVAPLSAARRSRHCLFSLLVFLTSS